MSCEVIILNSCLKAVVLTSLFWTFGHLETLDSDFGHIVFTTK